MEGTVVQLLAAALRTDPARPLLTAYDHGTGERTELSVATFANWVAKTANLLRDELDVQPGSAVALRVPLHWQAAVWLQAAWAVRAEADLDPEAVAQVTVVDHGCASPGPAGGDVVSLGLGPMGLPRPGVVPAYAGALDYDRAVHSHGDRFDGPPPAPGSVALRTRAGTLTHTALIGAAEATRPVLGPGDRVLVTEPLTTAGAALGTVVIPLLTGATAVVVRHLDRGMLPTLCAQESLVAALGPGQGALPQLSVPVAEVP